MEFDKTQKRALVFLGGLLGLSWYMGGQFEKADMMSAETFNAYNTRFRKKYTLQQLENMSEEKLRKLFIKTIRKNGLEDEWAKSYGKETYQEFLDEVVYDKKFGFDWGNMIYGIMEAQKKGSGLEAWEVLLYDSKAHMKESMMAETFEAQSRKTGEICGDNGCKGNLLETEYGGTLSKLHCDKCNYSEFMEWNAETFNAEEQKHRVFYSVVDTETGEEIDDGQMVVEASSMKEALDKAQIMLEEGAYEGEEYEVYPNGMRVSAENFGGEWVGEKHFEEYLPNKNDFYSTGLIAVAVGVGSYLYNRK